MLQGDALLLVPGVRLSDPVLQGVAFCFGSQGWNGAFCFWFLGFGGWIFMVLQLVFYFWFLGFGGWIFMVLQVVFCFWFLEVRWIWNLHLVLQGGVLLFGSWGWWIWIFMVLGGVLLWFLGVRWIWIFLVLPRWCSTFGS